MQNTMKFKKIKATASGIIFALCLSGAAEAGPFILDLTDADDHGSGNATENFDGWLYMQKVLENLAPGVTNGNKVVVQLGATGSEAAAAASSAFNHSSLVADGWTWMNIDGVADLTGFFDGTGLVTIADVGLIQLDSGFHAGGGTTAAELAVFTTFAATIDSFLGAGGGLHSMAQGGTGQYGWLSALLPALTFDTVQRSGLFLTPDGTAAFPGLTDSDLSAGPYHGTWTGGLGGLSVLFDNTAGDGGLVAGIGSGGGSITNPGGPGRLPEPSALALLGLGLVGIGFAQYRRRRKTS